MCERPRPEARPEPARGERDGVRAPPGPRSARSEPLHEGRSSPSPLVVTLLLADEAQQRFDRLRAEHFPPERNHLAAHVTLFHALPGEHRDAVDAGLATAADRPAFDVEVTGVRFLGRGVAYTLASAELTELRARLADAWRPWLTPQDRQRHAPHVTVQNKVAPATARELHARLAAAFAPETVPARGLGLWRYLGGPWEPVAEHAFR
ncbi:2'-5' RNA ligase family protein [Geodermatophilus sp. YIM 151500]|uniref:2'-5' RNA ligase family protein n=1 Tax=Geodermatophilus sp. YIM 151500 TaxID=2984531 RepID=UPI0021E35DA9|nr:2'-5' RNA ligase family protein [Geodermatophilus sp. YIM 151500]MCV2490695.1 2'-5' RNA ligase family protein [Geodermatophilus sp. YIM 151500]